MFKLGIIGSDNSHAIAYGKLANTGDGDYRVEDVQVTHIYGTDPVRTEEVAKTCNIPNIVTESEHMLGEVDGVICVWRHGSKHLRDTEPFIKAGLPAYVDKPLASSVADARQLIDTAQKAKVGFTSFSSLRYTPSTKAFLEGPRQGLGTLKGGFSTGHADAQDQYDGLYFYGIHAVEMMHTIFGYGVQSVNAVTNGKIIHATCSYGSGPVVTLNFIKDKPYMFHIFAIGDEKYDQFVVDSAGGYYEAMKVFMHVLRTGEWNFTPEQLLEPIQVLAASVKSLAENRTVAISEV